MEIAAFIGHALEQVHEEVQLTLKGRSIEELTYRPAPESNTMAWLAWHIARTQDVRSSHLTDRDQLWIADGWHERFGLPADPTETGRGHSAEQAGAVQPDYPESLREYCRIASDRAREYVSGLTPASLDIAVEAPDGTGPTTVSAILFRMVHGGLAHVGQLMYVRGLVERRIWFPR